MPDYEAQHYYMEMWVILMDRQTDRLVRTEKRLRSRTEEIMEEDWQTNVETAIRPEIW